MFLISDIRLNTRQICVKMLSFQAYEAIELDNLAKMFIRSVIKQECWDNMTVKGKSLRVRVNPAFSETKWRFLNNTSFQAFGKTLIVSNFPLKDRSKEELEQLEYVTKVRKTEMAEAKASKLDKKDVSLPVK